MLKEIFITAALAALTMVSFAGWWLMARQPEQWALWVERENEFWRGKGLISAGWAEKLKRWETGQGFRTLAAVTTVVGLIGVAVTGTVIVKGISLQHQKLRMPYNPALQVRPSKPPPSPAPKH